MIFDSEKAFYISVLAIDSPLIFSQYGTILNLDKDPNPIHIINIHIFRLTVTKISISGDPDSFEVEAFFRTILSFFTISFGSVGIGALIGILTALITKVKIKKKNIIVNVHVIPIK